MKLSRISGMRISLVKNLAQQYPLLGPILWIASVHFFVVEMIVAAAWVNPPYSYQLNAISDLGAVHCGVFDERMTCSPLHPVMNISFVILGLCMTIGAFLLYQAHRTGRVGFWLMGIAGLGAVLVGVFPEDTIYWGHLIGQDLAFLVGNLAIIVIGIGIHNPRWLRYYSISSGTIALIGLALFLSHNRFFLGLGGMERLIAYLQIVWLIIFGLYSLVMVSRSRRVNKRNS